MIRRNWRSASSIPAAVQRSAISPDRQRLTLRLVRRTHSIIDSHGLVEASVARMRIERAIDAFLDWLRLKRDATARSIDSYRRILWKLAEDYPEAVLSSLATGDLRRFLARWGESSAVTRSNVISVLHSFFGWAEAEDIIEADPSRKIRRPPKRKPDVYKPSLDELARVRAAALPA
jgi:hypothetical protein